MTRQDLIEAIIDDYNVKMREQRQSKGKKQRGQEAAEKQKMRDEKNKHRTQRRRFNRKNRGQLMHQGSSWK
jgi:hypothetical protein